MTTPRTSDARPRARVRVFWTGALVAGALAVLVTVTETLGPPAARSAAAAPPCSAAGDRREQPRCSTPGGTVLAIASEGEPLLLPGTVVRVVGSVLQGRTLRVRLRVRNAVAASTRLPVGRGQLRVTVAGRRFALAPLVGDGRRPGRVTMTVRFRLSERAADAIADGARPDLGVVPWRHLGEDAPPVLGVVRLEPTVVSPR